MIWTREEYLSHMTFHGSPRELFIEMFGPLIGLDAEWRSQGATEDEISLKNFGWDAVKYAHTGINLSPITNIKPHIISETDTEQISIDKMGRTMRLSKKCSTIALPFSYPVETPEDWFRIRSWYDFAEKRIDRIMLDKAKLCRTEGGMVIAYMPGGFDELRQLMGEENLCYAFYDEPEMIEDMLTHISDMTIHVLERVMEIVPIDLLMVHEDMAGISGPMIGPNLVHKFIAPYYRKIWNIAKDGGATLFSQDSDGNMEAVLDEFVAAGLNCFGPAEPKAGMDVVKLRRKYGNKLAFLGGIDKFALRGTKEDIRKELEYKLCSEMRGGGIGFGLDHRIPNGVPIENYRYYVELGRDMLGLPQNEPCEHIRMAL